jgi:hypothetical protein
LAAPAVEFVELQLTAAGENQMTFGGGSSVTLYSADGTITASGTFTSDPPNSENQRTILVGTSGVAAAFGVTPDLILVPMGDTLGTAGSACFNSNPFGSLDCVGWGAATQPAGTSPFGTPELNIPDGSSLVRSIASGNPGLHEFADDTNNSSADFFPDATPTPCPNSAAQPACNNPRVALPDSDGDGVPDQSDQCPTQAGPAPSGCPVQTKPTWSFNLDATKTKQKGATVLKRGVKITGSASTTGSVKITIRMGSTTIATGTITVTRSGSFSKRIKLTAAGKKKLKAKLPETIKVTGIGKPSGRDTVRIRLSGSR